LVTETMGVLQVESELEEIVKLVGYDSLSAGDRLTLEAARGIREDFLQQNSFDETDTYSSLQKQHGMLALVLKFYHEAQEALAAGASINAIFGLAVREKLARAKSIPENQFMDYLSEVSAELEAEMKKLVSGEVTA
ncbi:MAG: V-type ATP synthase subunit A, partial [Angelakisella sp.]